MSGGLHIGIPKSSEAEPLYHQRSGWVHRQRRPSDEDRCSSQYQPLIPLVTTKPAELHPPMQCTEKAEHDGAIGDLNAQCAIEERESNPGVDIGKGSLGCETGLVGEVDHSAGRAEIGERSPKSENEVGFRNGTGDCLSNTDLRDSSVRCCSDPSRFWDSRSSIVSQEGRSPLPCFLQQST